MDVALVARDHRIEVAAAGGDAAPVVGDADLVAVDREPVEEHVALAHVDQVGLVVDAAEPDRLAGRGVDPAQRRIGELALLDRDLRGVLVDPHHEPAGGHEHLDAAGRRHAHHPPGLADR